MKESEQTQTEAEAPGPKRSRAAVVIWAIFGGVSLLAATIILAVSMFFKMTFDKPVETFANALGNVLGTQVEVTGSTAVLEKSEIGELAVVQRKTQAITKFETTWLGSKKMLIVRGDFLVKAGFDLSEGGEWIIMNGMIDGPIPEGKVLSVEPMGDFEIYHAENGTINRLEPQDHARAFNHLKDQARRDAQRGDIADEAERVLIRRLADQMRFRDEALQWQGERFP
jgi:hypothetical protein